MNWTRSLSAAAMLTALPIAGHAVTQVAGLVQIGPSSGDGDAQNRSAVLATTITNRGEMPDRLINVSCPGSGNVALANGQMRQVGDGRRNGLDLPGASGGHATPVQARFNLTDMKQQPVGGLVPCSLYLEHAGQRIVIFSMGAHEPASVEP